MLSEQVTSSSEDGEVFVPVVRKMGSSFPAKITWSCVDGDAVFGDHYNLNEGKCKNLIYVFTVHKSLHTTLDEVLV